MRTISLYSGAGGLDIGFRRAGFDVIWANDFNRDACMSYSNNVGKHIRCGDINHYLTELSELSNIDLVIGGPPCQGFSVAGKMDPNDPRSQHVWTFADIVEKVSPMAFVMENVKALGELKKWEPLRLELLKRFGDLGYSVNFVVLNAKDFNVPQSRERVFFIGFKGNKKLKPNLRKLLEPYQTMAPTIREAFSVLDKAGIGNNKSLCKAKITLSLKPVMRKSPFAGMLFNGLGRPIRVNGYSATLPASMGGNKTPIIDEEELYNGAESWVENYHRTLLKGQCDSDSVAVPSRLRRLTVEEAATIQTFPLGYEFHGSQSSKFKQIGNAVPCNLAYAIALMVKDYLYGGRIKHVDEEEQYCLNI